MWLLIVRYSIIKYIPLHSDTFLPMTKIKSMPESRRLTISNFLATSSLDRAEFNSLLLVKKARISSVNLNDPHNRWKWIYFLRRVLLALIKTVVINEKKSVPFQTEITSKDAFTFSVQSPLCLQIFYSLKTRNPCILHEVSCFLFSSHLQWFRKFPSIYIF